MCVEIKKVAEARQKVGCVCVVCRACKSRMQARRSESQGPGQRECSKHSLSGRRRKAQEL